jgi:hypothetical protein
MVRMPRHLDEQPLLPADFQAECDVPDTQASILTHAVNSIAPRAADNPLAYFIARW